MPWIDLNEDPGKGNLNVRAYVASLVGPKRVAHGQRRVIQVPPTQSAELARNGSRGYEVVYVEVWLPNQLMAVGARILMSGSEGMGESADLVIFSSAAAGTFPGHGIDRYRAVLLPDEHLYAQAVSDAFGNPAGARTPLVVSSVTF